MKHDRCSRLLLLALVAVPAWAGTPGPLPEPGVLELLAIARRRRRRDNYSQTVESSDECV
jgi:hypothetical protein